jgi:ATP-dependent Lon protease
MNVFEVAPPSPEAARQIARNLYQGIRGEHGWGMHFSAEPQDDVLDLLSELPPRDMRRALMTGFGNARLERRDTLRVADLPRSGLKKGQMGFLQ